MRYKNEMKEISKIRPMIPVDTSFTPKYTENVNPN